MTEASARIVIVDDEEVIRYTLQKKLSRLGYNVVSLEKAEDAIYLIKNGDIPDLVITDIKLAKMDGIELLRRLRGLDEPVPVLIISGHGNVEDAINALRYGASDYIRKPFDINDVASSVRSIIRSKHEKKLSDNFAQFTEYEKAEFTLPTDISIINPISYRLTKDLVPSGICNSTTAENISLALREAISNALYHGNLQIPSEIREKGGMKEFNEEFERRKGLDEYRSKRLKILYELNRDFVDYTIVDQGNGFNYMSLPDPRDPANFLMNSGRGLLIIRVHMDEVEWKGNGNIVRLRKYKVHKNGEKPADSN